MAWPADAPPPQVTTDLRSCRQTTLHFHCAFEIRLSQSLAHMLDSLVRVSRRVGGAADLLTTERRAVPVRHSLYEPAPYLPAAEPGTRGWGTSPQLHPRPRSTTSSSSCEEQEKCSRPQSKAKPGVLADLTNQTCPTDSLNLLLRLRAHLRLPLHSFTYS